MCIWDNVCDTWFPTITIIITVVLGFIPIYLIFHLSNERLMKIGGTLLTMAAVPTLFVFSFLLIYGLCVVPNAKAAFKAGLPNDSVACFVPRTNLVRDIQRTILRSPSADDEPRHPGGYILIKGRHGCGKTTILKRALTESGPGILYVPVGFNGDISLSLYQSLRINEYCEGFWVTFYTFLKLPLKVCPDDPLSRLEYGLKILTQAATEIVQEEGYIPVVVFDNLSQTLKQQRFDGKQMVAMLQDAAKEMSDDKLLIVVFAASDSSVPNLMRARSSISRLIGTIDVGDITDEQASNYLTCMCDNASSDDVATAVNLVGGRFFDLLSAARIIKTHRDGVNETLEKLLLDTLQDLEKTLLGAVPRRVHTAVQEIARGILDSSTGTLTIAEYASYVEELDQTDLQLIDNLNIFLINSPDAIIFHSRLTQRYFESRFMFKKSNADQGK